jgi:S-adenosylmethionine:tRNA ribosyltransferase-isomerase
MTELSDHAAPLETGDFAYHLPRERIARRPAEVRHDARLMVVHRAGGRPQHRTCRELPELLAPGDLLVLNDTRVIPARLNARRRTGGKVELLLLQPEDHGAWSALLRPSRRIADGEELLVGDEGERVLVEQRLGEGRFRVRFRHRGAWSDFLARNGRIPLPPYIVRERGGVELDALDRERYQTVFARRPGAVAAPTAGLHFTPELLEALTQRGIRLAFLTLHVGWGTFRPIGVERLAGWRMEAERFVLPAETVEAIAAARARGGRVIAVGTTVVRVLEGLAAERGRLSPAAGTVDLFIRPGFRFSVIDGLLTNFHLPGSTLIILVAAFLGRERLLTLYRTAVARRYRFYSYGDAMLIL